MTPLYSKQAAKAIDRMDASTQQRIRKAIVEIPKGDIKPLRGAPGNYRLRIGDWRILFEYAAENAVKVKKIAPRGQVYKEG